MIDWTRFGVAIISMVVALALIASTTVLITTGYKDDIPSGYSELLAAAIFSGILGSAFAQIKP